MNKTVALYTKDFKKIAIIPKSKMIYSDIVATIDGTKIINFIQKDNNLYTNIENQSIKIEENKIYSNPTLKMLLYSDQNHIERYSIAGKQNLVLGNNEWVDINLNSLNSSQKIIIRKEKGQNQLIIDKSVDIYRNNKIVTKHINLSDGDVIDINGTEIIIIDNIIEIIDHSKQLKKVNLVKTNAQVSLKDVDSVYKRSPRFMYQEPDEDITLTPPPSEPNRSTEGLFKVIIPPLTMAGVTIGTGIMMNRGPMMYVMLLTTFVTIIFSVINFFKQQKEYKAKKEERIEIYNKYLHRKLGEIKTKISEQEYAINYHYPDTLKIEEMAVKASARMYEKTTVHPDFLMIRAGQGNIPLSFDIKFTQADFSEKEDHLFEEARQLKNRFSTLTSTPRKFSIKDGGVGLLGNPAILREQITLIIRQLIYFHSYHDLEIINVFNEDDEQYWSQFNFAPHLNSKVLHTRTNVYSERTRDQVLASFTQVLKYRKQQYGEKINGGTSLNFSPHFVLVINDMKQVMDHAIMEYLSEDISYLGVSVIYCNRSLKNLPEHVKNVIEYKNNYEGRVLTENETLKQEKIILDHIPNNTKLEKLPRIIAGFEHVQTLQSSIPEKVGFLELFDVERVEQLNILNRWQTSNPGKTLAVPLGYRGPKDVVNLNLHEKAHGPHGLVAGTTGSGKSEIVQSYILSLALNFHPYDVGFLLIDYKGGGMANLFKDLPHLLGTITNLDGAASMRALTAIKAELLRRQQIFSENDVNHIDGYQKLFKEGKVSEPMPHLFMISDEFAELKSEQPEFMKELVSTARIGRSLGIHLILATQKPSGVVDDQIWSNSKFKLCLKVQNASDSNEMLKTADAASITLPGRAYLQVGNNEIYELFQSAYSGAPYLADQEKEDVRDNRIYEVNKLGQLELKTKDLSKGNTGSIKISELEAVITEITKVFTASKLVKVASPWLEPLAEFISQDDLDPTNYITNWQQDSEDLKMVVGKTDEPQNQAQNNLNIDLTAGHIGIFGSSGFGKTTMLQSMIMYLARHNTPEQVNFYILDFGQGLLPLQKLPHNADLISIDEEEKIEKWSKIIANEIKLRKRLFKEAGVADIVTYRELTNQKMHRIVNIIDNYEAVKDAGFNENFEKVVNIALREGVSLGIHVIIGANRSSSIRYQMMSNIKQKITFYQIDQSDISGIMGRTQIKLPEIPGRGIVKLDDFYEFQACVAVNEESPLERIKKLRSEAEILAANWDGDVPEQIPIVPEVLTMNYFLKIPSVKQVISNPNKIALGVDFEKVEAVTANLSEYPLVIGANKKMILNITETIISTAGDNFEIVIFDTEKAELSSLSEKVKYFSDINQIEKHFATIYIAFEEAVISGNKTKILNEKRKLIIMNDVDSYAARTAKPERNQKIVDMVKQGIEYNISFVLLSEMNNYGQCNVTYRELFTRPECALVTVKGSQSRILNTVFKSYGEPEILPGEANLIQNEQVLKVKLIDKV